MASRPMTLDLLAALEILDEDVTAVVDAYLIEPWRRVVPIGDTYWVDSVAAVREHPFAQTLLAQPWASLTLKRMAIRATILLSCPERS